MTRASVPTPNHVDPASDWIEAGVASGKPSAYQPRTEFLSFSPPLIGKEEIAAVCRTLQSDWITTGPETRRFELQFADAVGAPAAVALNSCTAGLHTALTLLGIGPGDEVITTPMTFAASVNVIEHVGARPVLVDVEADTLNLDPSRVEAAITPRTRVILVVHFAGHPADMDPLRDVAERHGLAIVEDAAHALPARYRGRLIGSGANLAAFSFYATKNMTTAEGGMLTGAEELIHDARVISLHGMNFNAWKRYQKGANWFYEVVLPGFKYNMTDIQAAMGLCQLRKLAAFQARRRAIVAAYTAAFSAEDALVCPVERADIEHAWHLYIIRLRPGALRIGRDQVIQELTVRNIGTSVHFIPIHLHPYYRAKYRYAARAFPIAYDNYRQSITLPLYPRMGDDDVHDVIDAVHDVITKHRR